MRKLDLLYSGYNSDYQMYLNDRQAWLEREAEYLRGGSVKPAAPAPAPAPAAPAAPVDGMVINSNVALKPKPTVPRDTRTNVVTIDLGAFLSSARGLMLRAVIVLGVYLAAGQPSPPCLH